MSNQYPIMCIIGFFFFFFNCFEISVDGFIDTKPVQNVGMMKCIQLEILPKRGINYSLNRHKINDLIGYRLTYPINCIDLITNRRGN
jgi:hypothetical protein